MPVELYSCELCGSSTEPCKHWRNEAKKESILDGDALEEPAPDLSLEEGEQLIALQHDLRVREIDENVKATWAELGALCILVQKKREWKILGHHSFDAWLLDAAPTCRSTAYSAMKAIDELSGDVTAADMAEIPHGNAHILRQVSSSVRKDPKIIAAAKSERPKQFRETIQKAAPGQHLEAEQPKKLYFSESERTVVEEAIEAFKVVKDLPTMTAEQVIEAICVDWMESLCVEGSISDIAKANMMSNREAYEAIRTDGRKKKA